MAMLSTLILRVKALLSMLGRGDKISWDWCLIRRSNWERLSTTPRSVSLKECRNFPASSSSMFSPTSTNCLMIPGLGILQQVGWYLGLLQHAKWWEGAHTLGLRSPEGQHTPQLIPEGKQYKMNKMKNCSFLPLAGAPLTILVYATQPPNH